VVGVVERGLVVAGVAAAGAVVGAVVRAVAEPVGRTVVGVVRGACVVVAGSGAGSMDGLGAVVDAGALTASTATIPSAVAELSPPTSTRASRAGCARRAGRGAFGSMSIKGTDAHASDSRGLGKL
jgi:hypothetical protein